MALLVPNEGEQTMLERIVALDISPGALTLHLYTNDIDPAEAHAYASNPFTEATGSGYAAEALTGTGGFAWSVNDDAGTAYAIYQDGSQEGVAFNFTGSISIVGYYITTQNAAAGTKLLFAERLYDGTGQNFGANDTLKVTPRLELS